MGKFSKINTGLVVLIVFVNCYVILMPFLPMLSFYLPAQAGQLQRLHDKVTQTTPTEVKNQPNTIIIPKMLLDQPVLEGQNTYKVLEQGILRWPASSTPDKGSNTVVLGHRFTYKNPRGAFYYLDKLKPGDEVGIIWNNKHYLYKVEQVRVVKPTETSILGATDEPKLTLFTCTPLLWPKDRLVVIAGLVSPTPPSEKIESGNSQP